MKPNEEIWRRVNLVVLNENAGEVLVTLISGLASLLFSTGVFPSMQAARAHLAAMVLSPDGEPTGALLPLLKSELERLAKNLYMPS